MPTENPRITFTLSDDLRAAINDYQFEHRCKNQTQAILALINRGLQVINGPAPTPNERHSPAAIRVASDYDALDPHGQRAVRAIMDVELSRVNDPPAASPASVVRLRRYLEPAAAGSPLWSESGFEYVDYPGDVVPSGADFAVGISGHSMEPDLPDDCTVFVRQTQSVGDGDIIVAWIDGEGTICKRVVAPFGQIIGLESINPDYPGFSGDQLLNMRIYGKVIGYIRGNR